MQLRHLHYLEVLARERHFGRAADACHVTQSTLSAAIRQLETEVGVPLVERDRRFRAFTPEGEILLAWARRILSERSALSQALELSTKGLTGRLRLGVIPVATPVVALLTDPFCRAHPNVSVAIASRTSVEIQRGLDEFSFDGGVTYLDHEPVHGARSVPLYTERYILLAPAEGPLAERDAITWREAASLPLCLLEGGMQNRRIVNGIFREAGVLPTTRVETNSMMTLASHLRTGSWATVLPHSFLWAFGLPPGMRALPLKEPERSHVVGLVVRDQDPVPPLVTALVDTAKRLDLQPSVDAQGPF